MAAFTSDEAPAYSRNDQSAAFNDDTPADPLDNSQGTLADPTGPWTEDGIPAESTPFPDDPSDPRGSLGEVGIDEIDNPGETILAAASLRHGDPAAPEVTEATANLTDWDEPADISGGRTPDPSYDRDETDAQHLVEAGIEEADRQQRVASGELPE